MSRTPSETIVEGIAARPAEDVIPMLNQIHTATDLAADRRRVLRAEADAYRLARSARHAALDTGARGARRRGWLQLLGVRRTARAA